LQAQIKGQSNIDYVGFKNGQELARLIARARAVVVPSEWYENCPMSLLEAKAYGKPIIGARIGGIPELVREGVDGFLFTPGNIAELKNALGALDKNCELFGQNARKDVEARLSPTTYLDALLHHYRCLKQDRNEQALQPA